MFFTKEQSNNFNWQVIAINNDDLDYAGAGDRIVAMHLPNRSYDLLLCYKRTISNLANVVQCVLCTWILCLRFRIDKLLPIHTKLYQDGLARLRDASSHFLQELFADVDFHDGYRCVDLLQFGA